MFPPALLFGIATSLATHCSAWGDVAQNLFASPPRSLQSPFRRRSTLCRRHLSSHNRGILDQGAAADVLGGSLQYHTPERRSGLPTVGKGAGPVERPILPESIVGVIFDMDGTLVEHCIDFGDMRRRIYAIAEGDDLGKHLKKGCVLEMAPQFSPEWQRRANEVFADIEQRAIDEMKIMPGAAGLLRYLDANGMKRAIVTRNVERSVDALHDLLHISEGVVSFEPAVARDTTSTDGNIRAKPAPDAILHICASWGCDPSDVIMVGDSATDDIAAANRAGCGGSVLLTQKGGVTLDNDSGNTGKPTAAEELERIPGLSVESLADLQVILEELLNNQ